MVLGLNVRRYILKEILAYETDDLAILSPVHCNALNKRPFLLNARCNEHLFLQPKKFYKRLGSLFEALRYLHDTKTPRGNEKVEPLSERTYKRSDFIIETSEFPLFKSEDIMQFK